MNTAPPSSTDPEHLWEFMLSRQADQIRAAFTSLTPEEQAAVLAHLTRMAQESGWHPEQRLSAQVALQTLDQNDPAC